MNKDITVRVGERYYNRDRHVVRIVTKIDVASAPKLFAEHSETPFIGYNESNGDWNSYNMSGHCNPYEEGFEDLVEEFEPSPVLPDITIDVINVGDIAAEMHGHETNSGKLKGWTVSSKFEISDMMFRAMYNTLHRQMSNWKPASGKMAYIVAINEDENYFEEVESVMVIYIYDSSYHTATLTRPK